MAFGTYGTDQISGILPMRREMIFSRQINVICPVQSPLAKIFRLRRRANQKYNLRRLIPHEGRWPSSRTLGWDAVDAAASGAHGSAGRVPLPFAPVCRRAGRKAPLPPVSGVSTGLALPSPPLR